MPMSMLSGRTYVYVLSMLCAFATPTGCGGDDDGAPSADASAATTDGGAGSAGAGGGSGGSADGGAAGSGGASGASGSGGPGGATAGASGTSLSFDDGATRRTSDDASSASTFSLITSNGSQLLTARWILSAKAGSFQFSLSKAGSLALGTYDCTVVQMGMTLLDPVGAYSSSGGSCVVTLSQIGKKTGDRLVGKFSASLVAAGTGGKQLTNGRFDVALVVAP